jgi:hypothetical protein
MILGKGKYADFWKAHREGKIRDITITTCLDPAARYNHGRRAHLREIMARHYKDKKTALEKAVEAAEEGK